MGNSKFSIDKGDYWRYLVVSFIFFDDHLLRAVIFSIFSYFFDTIVEFAIALSGLEDS